MFDQHCTFDNCIDNNNKKHSTNILFFFFSSSCFRHIFYSINQYVDITTKYSRIFISSPYLYESSLSTVEINNFFFSSLFSFQYIYVYSHCIEIELHDFFFFLSNIQILSFQFNEHIHVKHIMW